MAAADIVERLRPFVQHQWDGVVGLHVAMRPFTGVKTAMWSRRHEPPQFETAHAFMQNVIDEHGGVEPSEDKSEHTGFPRSVASATPFVCMIRRDTTKLKDVEDWMRTQGFHPTRVRFHYWKSGQDRSTLPPDIMHNAEKIDAFLSETSIHLGIVEWQ